MTSEIIKRMFDACYQAKRTRDMLPPLPEGVRASFIQYLDVIQSLERKGIQVKVSDLSDAMELPRPGVTRTVKEMEEKGILCYGPYAADGFMGSGNYTHFDGILAMYHDQGLAPFKALAMEDGVNYTAGLPVVRTSPAHGTAYDIAGKGVACEDSFRQAIYVAIDVFRNRQREKVARANPLRKQYYEKRDDSDKLKLDTVDED